MGIKIIREPSPFFRYSFSILVTGIAFALTRSIHPLLEHHALDLFQGAVFLSAWYGGLGPGLLAAVVSMLSIDYFLMPPLYTLVLGLTDIIRLVVFGSVAVLISTLSGKLHEAQHALQQAHHDLKRRLEERTTEVLDVSGNLQRRMGQDIHDGLCQTLAGLRFLIEALKIKIRRGETPDLSESEKIQSRVETALTQAYSVARGLFPVELEANGLPSALEELAETVSKVYSVTCRLDCWSTIHIQDEMTANHLYRIAQEAVMNAVKSGKATQVRIHLFVRSGRIFLSVRDNGIGFDIQSVHKGMGLKIMEYRAAALNATLLIRRTPHGIRVSSIVPSERPAGMLHG
jgi:signal transduction histidine kinase